MFQGLEALHACSYTLCMYSTIDIHRYYENVEDSYGRKINYVVDAYPVHGHSHPENNRQPASASPADAAVHRELFGHSRPRSHGLILLPRPMLGFC